MDIGIFEAGVRHTHTHTHAEFAVINLFFHCPALKLDSGNTRHTTNRNLEFLLALDPKILSL